MKYPQTQITASIDRFFGAHNTNCTAGNMASCAAENYCFCPYQMIAPDQGLVKHWTGSYTWSHNGTQVGSVGPNGQ